MTDKLSQIRKPKFKSWGDAELDRLWLKMYEIEMSIDDMDLCDRNSPKLKLFEIARDEFNTRFTQVRGEHGRF